MYDRKNADNDNDGCNDNYDGKFDDNYDKNYQKTYKCKKFWGKNLPILLHGKKVQKFWQPLPPGNGRKNFLREVFP